MSGDDRIGNLEWEACYHCRHGDDVHGGCKKKADADDMEIDMDEECVKCRLFEDEESPE